MWLMLHRTFEGDPADGWIGKIRDRLTHTDTHRHTHTHTQHTHTQTHTHKHNTPHTHVAPAYSISMQYARVFFFFNALSFFLSFLSFGTHSKVVKFESNLKSSTTMFL